MKRIQVLLTAAIVFAVGSAFTTVDEAQTDIYVQLENNSFVLRSTVEDEGSCQARQDSHCEFTQVSAGVYQPVPGDNNRAWIAD